eukprot:6785803-Prymnesium_polylepis.1
MHMRTATRACGRRQTGLAASAVADMCGVRVRRARVVCVREACAACACVACVACVRHAACGVCASSPPKTERDSRHDSTMHTERACGRRSRQRQRGTRRTRCTRAHSAARARSS